jgi:putative transposase
MAERQFLYVFLGATYCKARMKRVVSQTVMIATGVRADGWRAGFAVGSRDELSGWRSCARQAPAGYEWGATRPIARGL